MGKRFDVKIAPAAIRQLTKLTRQVQERILKKLETLAENPRPAGVEKLAQDPRLWRLRVGDYRVIYWIDDAAGVLVTLIVRHRSEAYRDLDKLNPQVVATTIAPLLSALVAPN